MLYGGVVQTLLISFLAIAALICCWRFGGDGQSLLVWLVICLLFHLSSSNSLFSMKMQIVFLLMALDLPSGSNRRRAKMRPALVRDPIEVSATA